MSPPAFVLTLAIRAYQFFVRPLLAPACRFTPSCSTYAIDALRTHGALCGVCLASWRVLRCNPFVPGGHDPVPPAGTLTCRPFPKSFRAR